MAASHESSRLALVTGANRGIGLEIARRLSESGLRVLLAARDEAKARAASAAVGGGVIPLKLDVDDAQAIAKIVSELERAHGPIDVLVNNAAILIDGPGGFSSSLFDLTDETFQRTWRTNVLGPTALIRAILPGMIARGYGRVVNMSSTAGQLQGMGSGYPAYRMSKTALNALTRIAAAEAKRGDVKVNAACPGWVRTDMGGPQASRSAEEGAETPVWLALLAADGPTGGFFHDKAPTPW
ncbi:MAG: SDR family NAD(P)-dependent oxidoreductase [Hyphomicrobium sp.]